MTIDHNYLPDPDWQRGFTILECWETSKKVRVTPHVIIAQDGAFAWAGEVYDGRAIMAEKRKRKAQRKGSRRRGSNQSVHS